VKRGVLKELTNTATAIVCGYQLYGPDLPQLRRLTGQPVAVDLLSGACTSADSPVEPPLAIERVLTTWVRELIDREGVPVGMVSRAVTILYPTAEPSGQLLVECRTTVESLRGTFESQDVIRWHAHDINDSS
jgi:hypothetical protein